MKKKLSLLVKLKIVASWLFEHRISGVIVTCGMCGSTEVKYMDGVKHDDNVYNSRYQCMKCGAIAHNEEIWNKH